MYNFETFVMLKNISFNIKSLCSHYVCQFLSSFLNLTQVTLEEMIYYFMLSEGLIFCIYLFSDLWCTLKETAEKPHQERSSKASTNTCQFVWTSSSITSYRSCREFWVMCMTWTNFTFIFLNILTLYNNLEEVTTSKWYTFRSQIQAKWIFEIQ